MDKHNPETSQQWVYAIALAVTLAGVSAFMVVKRHEFFPEMYVKDIKHSEFEQVKDSSVHQPNDH